MHSQKSAELWKRGILILICWASFPGCSHSPVQPTNSTDLGPASRPEQTIQELSVKIDALEKRYEELQQRCAMAHAASSMTPPAAPGVAAPLSHPAEGAGTIPAVSLHPLDPESGYVVDDAVQIYRNAKVLHQSGKYPEAILAFSDFLEKFPDHPIAGAAQYYVGNSYLKQKNYGSALKEYQKIITSYDRSSHIPDALKDLVQIENHLGRPDDAAKYRQLLTSLFPQSPAAGVIVNTPEGGTSGALIDEPPPATAPLETEKNAI